MPRKLTRAEFLMKAAEAHPAGRYDYSQTVYLPTPQKVAIRCLEHGVFMQTAAMHLYGKGCPLCANKTKILAAQAAVRKWDTVSFVARCQELHPTLDFSGTIYVAGKYGKASYYCPSHGVKSAYINALLKGHGCADCHFDRVRGAPQKTRQQWISEFEATHAGAYGYALLPASFMEWEKLPIVCPTHGQFMQVATTHRAGAGCKKCSSAAAALRMARPRTYYLEKFSAAHGEKYDYSLLPDSFSATEKLPIVCPTHGVFMQSADTHASHGCRRCASKAHSVQYTGKSYGWGYKQWLAKVGSKPATLYLLRLTLGAEAFFKIGITYKSVSGRFNKSNLPYDYEILATETLADAAAICELERNLKRRFVSKKHRPLLAFAGRSECYGLDSRIDEAFPNKPLPVGRRPALAAL